MRPDGQRYADSPGLALDASQEYPGQELRLVAVGMAEREYKPPFARERAPLSGPYERVVAWFPKERALLLSDETPFERHLASLDAVDGLAELVAAHARPADDLERAFLMELVLEGLVQSLRIAREDLDSTVTYTEMARLNLMRGRG